MLLLLVMAVVYGSAIDAPVISSELSPEGLRCCNAPYHLLPLMLTIEFNKLITTYG